MTFLETIQISIEQIQWSDCIEIFCIATVWYYFVRWLAQDPTQPLIGYAYRYVIALCGSHYMQLTVISTLLLQIAPLIGCIFIVLHQKTLQKNFVALKKIIPARSGAIDWIDELMRSTLYAMNKSKTIIWIIERTEQINQYLESSCVLYADLKKDLVELLLDAQDDEIILWINQSGKLVALNTTWHPHLAHYVNPDVEQLPSWQQYALALSSTSNAIVIYSCARTRLLTLITKEQRVDGLTAHHASLLLQKLITTSPSPSQGGTYASNSSTRPTSEQRQP